MSGSYPAPIDRVKHKCNFLRMSNQTVPVNGRVTPEIAAFVEAYANKRGVTRSRAVAELLARASGLDAPEKRGRGRVSAKRP